MNVQTEQVGLVGWPISHSLSPVMQNAAFAAVGLPWQYRLFPTRAAEFAPFMESLQANLIVGANVTMPHKQAVIPYLKEISRDARVIGAVNTIHLQEGSLSGYNTDSIGFLRALIEAGHEPEGIRVVMLGAGGAARAAVFALAQAGAEHIVIVNRTLEHAERLRLDMAAAFPSCAFEKRTLHPRTFLDLPADVDLVVNATSLGMEPQEDACPWPDEVAILPDTLFYDVIYKPERTLFLQKAQAAGLPTLNGLGMLLHQGAASFEIWTGKPAPLETMREALQAALAHG